MIRKKNLGVPPQTAWVGKVKVDSKPVALSDLRPPGHLEKKNDQFSDARLLKVGDGWTVDAVRKHLELTVAHNGVDEVLVRATDDAHDGLFLLYRSDLPKALKRDHSVEVSGIERGQPLELTGTVEYARHDVDWMHVGLQVAKAATVPVAVAAAPLAFAAGFSVAGSAGAFIGAIAGLYVLIGKEAVDAYLVKLMKERHDVTGYETLAAPYQTP